MEVRKQAETGGRRTGEFVDGGLEEKLWGKKRESRTLCFPQGRLKFWLHLWWFVVLRQCWRNKQTHTHTHTRKHTLPLAVAWILDARRWMMPIKQEWIDAGMDGEEEVAPSLVYLFSRHTLPSKIFVRQILLKNLSNASREVHCVCGMFVGEEIFVCYLSTPSLNLPLLIVALKIHSRRRISNTFKATSGWSKSRLETFISLVFNMVIESVSALLLRDKCLQHSC